MLHESFNKYALKKIRESCLITCPRCRGTMGDAGNGEMICYSCDFRISREENESRVAEIDLNAEFKKIRVENGSYWRCLVKYYPGEYKDKKEATTMKVEYNGFTGELVKLERKEKVELGPCKKEYVYDISIHDKEKRATISFNCVRLADVKFLSGAVSFG